uniref:Putative ovule protein n=1 Tax=Solanum chacoense TaxID=4108 RepID=A0A0V0H589_SOLCH
MEHQEVTQDQVLLLFVQGIILGIWWWPKVLKIQETTNLVAEARAIWECLEYCKDQRLTNIIIESYSMAMVQILEGTWKPPWSVALEVNHIIRLRRFVSSRVQHSLREGNTLADFFC